MAFTRSSLRHLSLLGLAAVSVVASPSHPLLKRGLTLRQDGAPYVGCFIATGDAMMDNELVSDDLTVSACAQNCAGYTYFGIEYSRECWCGNELPATSAEEAACAAADTGSAPEICDDNEWIRVWIVPAVTTTTSSSTSSSTSTSTSSTESSTSSSSSSVSSSISVPLTTAPSTTLSSNTSSSIIYGNTTTSSVTSIAAPLTTAPTGTNVNTTSSSIIPIFVNTTTSSVLSSVGPVDVPVTPTSVPLSTGTGVTSAVDPILTSAPYANSTSTVSSEVLAVPATEMTTSTVFATTVRTITSCAPTVTNCPAESTVVVTETIPVYTTICPVTEAGGRLTTIVEGGYTTVLPISTSTIYATVTEIQTTRVIPGSTVGGTVFYSTVTESATTKVAPVGTSTVFATVTEKGVTRVTLVRPTPTNVVVVVVTVTATICPTETGAAGPTYTTITLPESTVVTPVSTSTIFSSVTVGGTVKVTVVGSSVVYTTVTVGATTRVTEIGAPGSGSTGVSSGVGSTFVGSGTGYPIVVPTSGVWSNSTSLTRSGTGYPAASGTGYATASGSVVTSHFSNVTSLAVQTSSASVASTLTFSNTTSATTETSTFQSATTTADRLTSAGPLTVSDEPTATPSDVTLPTAQPTSTASEESTVSSQSATVTSEPITTTIISVDPTTTPDEPTIAITTSPADPTTTPDEPTITTQPETPSSTAPCQSTTVLAATPSPCLVSIPTACASLTRTPALPYPALTAAASQCSAAYYTGATNAAIASCFTNIRSPQLFSGPSAYACVSAAPVYCSYETLCVGATPTGPVASIPTNAVDDGGFEAGHIPSSWTASGTMSPDSVISVSVSTDVARQGAYALKTVFANTNGGSRGWTQQLSLEPGALYEASWWYYSTNSAANTVSRMQLSGGGLSSFLLDASTRGGLTNTWVRVSQRFTPTASFANMYFSVYGNLGDAANVFYVDDVAVTKV